MKLLFASQAKLGYMQRQNYIIKWLKFINHYLNELKNANKPNRNKGVLRQ